MKLRDEDKEFLSTILKGNDEDAILSCAVEAARFWGLDPDPDSDDEEMARVESDVLELIGEIHKGVADGTITVASPKTVSDVVVTDEEQRVIDAIRAGV